MIHAYRTNGVARCGQRRRQGEAPVTQVLYRDLCRACLAAILQSCLRGAK